MIKNVILHAVLLGLSFVTVFNAVKKESEILLYMMCYSFRYLVIACEIAPYPILIGL